MNLYYPVVLGEGMLLGLTCCYMSYCVVDLIQKNNPRWRDSIQKLLPVACCFQWEQNLNPCFSGRAPFTKEDSKKPKEDVGGGKQKEEQVKKKSKNLVVRGTGGKKGNPVLGGSKE